MDDKSTLGKKCNSELNKVKELGLEPSIQILDNIRMFARVYSPSKLELHVDSMN